MFCPIIVVRHSGFEIGIRLYGVLKIATKGAPKKLNREDNKFVESKRRYICNDSQNPLKYEDIKKGFKYGGEQVVFTKAEVQQLRHQFDLSSITNAGPTVPCPVVYVARGLHHAARCYELIGVLSALLCPNWGFRSIR